MAEFAYNNIKNISTGHAFFKLNYQYFSNILLKDETDPYLRSCSANKLAEQRKKLIEICYLNLLYV